MRASCRPIPSASMGEGFVSFRVKPRPGIFVGATIANKARIYFDENEPIDTNTTHNVIVNTLPNGLRIYLPLIRR